MQDTENIEINESEKRVIEEKMSQVLHIVEC